MTVLTFGFFKHQANARLLSGISSFTASAKSFFTLSNFPASPNALSFSHSNPFNPSREFFGTPSIYFPVSTPEASGDQMVVPIPKSEYNF